MNEIPYLLSFVVLEGVKKIKSKMAMAHFLKYLQDVPVKEYLRPVLQQTHAAFHCPSHSQQMYLSNNDCVHYRLQSPS